MERRSRLATCDADCSIFSDTFFRHVANLGRRSANQSKSAQTSGHVANLKAPTEAMILNLRLDMSPENLVIMSHIFAMMNMTYQEHWLKHLIIDPALSSLSRNITPIGSYPRTIDVKYHWYWSEHQRAARQKSRCPKHLVSKPH